MQRLSIEQQRFADLLKYCSKNQLLDQGKHVHGALMKIGFGSDMVLNNHLIDMYAKCEKIEIAHNVFDKMLERNVVSWTALMCGFLQNGDANTTLSLFSRVGKSGVNPNEFTFSTNLKACGITGVAKNGTQIHGTCVKTGFDLSSNVVGNSIIDMYAKCEKLEEAAKMFSTMRNKNLICWNTMISAYSSVGFGEKALVLFRKMLQQCEIPDEFTFRSTLKACSVLTGIQLGAQIHGFLLTSGFPYSIKPITASALVDFYVKCGCLFEARKVFDQIESKNVISWSSIILGYAQDENLSEAMHLFKELRCSSGVRVDGFVLSSMIGVFSDFALVEQGKQMHAYAVKIPAGLDTSVSNSIVDMYLKCGQIFDAEKLFDEIPSKDIISWTIMITGYGKYGLGKKAICLFNEMQSRKFAEPDDVTYLAILSACSHSGLLEDSQRFFSSLCSNKKIKPRIEHYSCMVDLFGRLGKLNEAKNLIVTMPIKPNVGIWQTLLSACRVHGNLELAREVGEILLKLDTQNPANYVMLANIYANAGYWKESEAMRKIVKTKGLQKIAGRSWTEIDKQVHVFFGGDDTHPQIEKIHNVLKEMERRMKQELGYVYGVKYALHDVEDESKIESLRAHSEKLAIGLALAQGGLEEEGRVVRIFKNLRACGDCHEFIKGLSKILKMVFVVRDANRFHRFEGGICSCGDYW